MNGAPDNKAVGNAIHAIHTDKRERRTRNKDRPDRGVWTPLRHSGTHGEMKLDILSVHGAEFRPSGSGRGSQYSVDNGSYRHGGRRGSAYNTKDADGPSFVEGKPLKRGGSSGYGSHEKQVWIQKSCSGS
ncbi:regulator of nonsense transcripts UPF3-like isoform X3 [Olea europaea var. sylvestris]|uniref:regulator of nonsense transcripts UPF3-like isoform X3 n=1 Tax=Olea europaea var. sylvestris TaxID=158386 RepID=UPI000C1D2C81|nr:regulator of nonsense transcripts UPF3-like isoform X3 [Olea europaea var. sylvestris]XP_022876567.1 regulator of nonsense transcripts UPF3-like isoform X3 [Olea europaea var. sylvestris]